MDAIPNRLKIDWKYLLWNKWKIGTCYEIETLEILAPIGVPYLAQFGKLFFILCLQLLELYNF